MGIGASVASVWFSFRPLKNQVGVKMLGSVAIFAVAILVFGISTSFHLSLAALIVAGAADMVSVYVRSSLIQLHTPDEMRGRVSAVSQLTISASNELGEAESGLAASLLGPVGAVVAGAVGALVITLAWSRLYPELRQARTFDPPPMPDLEPKQGVATP
jgi:MFS family permease